MVLLYVKNRPKPENHVDDECKKELSKVGVPFRSTPTFTHNEGQMAYINERGLYNLINGCKMSNKHEVKVFFDQYFYDRRYKHGLMDIFTFIRDRKLAIDIESDWFQELWYPLSKKCHVLGSMALLDWLGYEGENYLKQRNFKKLLDNNNIPYEEISYNDDRFMDHPSMKRELERTNAGNVNQKRWLVMTTRDFKKAILRLNTKNGEMIRDYYLNLEEACFEYAEYQANWSIKKSEAERILKEGQLMKMDKELSSAMEQLALKDKSFEEETRELKLRAERAEKDAEDQRLRLRSETKRLKEQIKRTLEFNQATKCVEPLEYIYICTTEYYQRQHKFKVGGVQTFELLRSRLTQYNSGEADSEAHFFIYVRKTVSYRSIEQSIKGLLSGFRENQSNELYIMHYDWLIKFVDAILDGNADFAVLVNSNRQQIADDTINKDPTIVPPIQLEQIMYLRAGDTPRDLTTVLDPEIRRAIQEAVDSFEPDNNTVKRREFEEYLMRMSPNVKLDGKKRDAWEMTRALGSSKNPMWRYKY
jgi:MSV199 domain/T5orf172 domain